MDLPAANKHGRVVKLGHAPKLDRSGVTGEPSPMRVSMSLFLCLLSSPLPAHVEPLPPIRESVDACKPDKVTLEQGFISRGDVNGDGEPDFILDYGAFRCSDSASFFCGSAGCTTQVFASVDGEYVKVLDENVQGLAFKRVRGRPAMLLGLHGSSCGRKGAQPCGTTLYWNGTKFSPAD